MNYLTLNEGDIAAYNLQNDHLFAQVMDQADQQCSLVNLPAVRTMPTMADLHTLPPRMILGLKTLASLIPEDVFRSVSAIDERILIEALLAECPAAAAAAEEDRYNKSHTLCELDIASKYKMNYEALIRSLTSDKVIVPTYVCDMDRHIGRGRGKTVIDEIKRAVAPAPTTLAGSHAHLAARGFLSAHFCKGLIQQSGVPVAVKRRALTICAEGSAAPTSFDSTNITSNPRHYVELLGVDLVDDHSEDECLEDVVARCFSKTYNKLEEHCFVNKTVFLTVCEEIAYVVHGQGECEANSQAIDDFLTQFGNENDMQ